MKIKNNMKRNERILIYFTLFIASCLFLCGCTEQKTPDTSDQDEHDAIIGTWIMNEAYSNITYRITYAFYANHSFFSGVQNTSSTTDTYEISIWGTFSISNDNITLTTTNPDASSTLQFIISEDNQSLLLYHEDQINFDVFNRVQ
jgi:hypothetical protein